MLLLPADVYAAPPYRGTTLLGAPSDAQLSELVSHTDQWAPLRARVGGIIHSDHGFNEVSDETLRTLFAVMASQKISLELEVGAVKKWSPDGARTFEIERVVWDRVIHLGAHVVSLAMDEPLVSAISDLHRSPEYAAQEVARFVSLVRRNYPDLLIGDIEAYPFTSVAAHARWIDQVNEKLRQLGVPPLDFYRIDPDFAAFPSKGNWTEVADIVGACRRRHLPSSVILWAATAAGHSQDPASDRAWFDGLLNEANQLRVTRIRPDQVVVESWIRLPSRALPESDPLTFTGSAMAALAVLRGSP